MAITTTDFSAEWSNFRTAGTSTLTRNEANMLLTPQTESSVPGDRSIFEWDALRGNEEADILVRCRVNNTAANAGFQVWARMGEPPLNPTDASASATNMYMLEVSSNIFGQNRLYIDTGFINRVSAVLGSGYVNTGVTLVAGTWYWLRFSVTKSGTSDVLRGKFWADGDAEPDWALTRTVLDSSTLFSDGVRWGVGNGGIAAASTKVYEWDSATEFLTVVPPPDPGDPGGPVLGDAGDRLRSSISETTGSLLEAVDVRAVDASVSEAYTWAQELVPAQPVVFRELFRERDSAEADFVYYPRPRQNLVMENQYEGVTVLSRLASYYPARVFDTVDSTGLGITTSGGATAQQVLEFLLNRWALDTGWLAYEPVPDLRLRLPGFAPSDYWAPRFGTVRTPVLAFPQDRARRRSALEILQALLSPFPGTVLRQNSAGRLEIVPTYGPDADEVPAITLEPIDLYSVTIGKPDPFSVFNRATFASQGYERAEDVELMQPAWFQVGSNIQFGRSNWFSPPNDRLNLQPPPEGFDTVQESYTAGEDYALNRPNLWPISNDRIPAGDGISLVDSVGDPLVTMAWARYFNDSLVDSGTNGLTIVTPVIPFSGAWVTAFSVLIPLPQDDAWATIRARWNDARQGIEFGLADPTKLETNCFTGCNGVIIEFTLNDASTGYIETGTTTGSFGFVDEGDSLPAVGGGNAVLDSQTEFGVLEASVTIEGYSLDAGTLVEVARAFVLENITPKVVRELDLSTIGVRLGFDSIGRLVELPNTEQGRVIGRTYADDFVARSWRATAEVEVPNALGPGAVDVSTDWLLNDDLSFWTNSDGSFSEPL
jgi:hypothetical protein